MARSCGCSKGRGKLGCMGITLTLLNSIKSKYECVLDNSLYSEVGMTELYIRDKLTLLNSIIIDKSNAPASCTFKTQVDQMQADMNTIIMNSTCG